MIESSHLFVLAILVFGFGLGSKKLTSSIITAPMAFVAFGLFLAPDVCERLGLGGLFSELEHLDSTIHLLGEITLVVVLFTDAAQIQIHTLIKAAAIPSRLLFVGMPLTILLGALVGSFFFNSFGIWELALLATMLRTRVVRSQSVGGSGEKKKRAGFKTIVVRGSAQWPYSNR